VVIDVALVAKLLTEQHPDLAHHPLRSIAAGWDNALFRLGDEWAVRLPRRALAAPLILHEQRWLPELAKRLPLPVPTPVRCGGPGRVYPWSWSIVPWLRGQPAADSPLNAGEAPRFGAFLRALHQPAPGDAPANPVRGVPLSHRAAAVEERMERLAARTDCISPAIRDIWRQALAAPLDRPPTWLHGDLHPRNVLGENGRITGVIDWGDLTAGDNATDLAAIWMVFPDLEARTAACAAYGELSEATIRRAKGWALLFGVVFLDTGLIDNPGNAALGEQILRQLAQAEAQE
jgi:aminoglycoside phosphotransferase (APT) family kinase protein